MGQTKQKACIVFKMEISVVCLAIQQVVFLSPAQRPVSAHEKIHTEISSEIIFLLSSVAHSNFIHPSFGFVTHGPSF